MTSLTETLPILDQAVPALPDKVQAVARESDEFHQAAQEALAAFRQKRGQAEALVEQVRQALEALLDQASHEQQRVETATLALQQAAEEEARGVEDAADELHREGEQTVTAFGGLESQLVQAGDRTRAAHQEAHVALDALGEEARTSQPEIERAVDEMTAAVASAQQVITEGQTLVAEGVSALKDATARLLADAQERLGRTYQHLDELRAEQEKAVTEAISTLATERQQLEQELGQRLDTEVEQALDPELEAVEGALGEMGRQVLELQADTEARREDLDEQLKAVAERIPPLQGGAQQVKQAADQVGIAWP